MEKKWQDIGSRLLTMLITLPIIFTCLFLGGWWYAALGLSMGIQCAFELRRLILPSNYGLLGLLIVVSVVVLATISLFHMIFYVVLVTIVIVMIQSILINASQIDTKWRLVWIAIAAFYVGLPLAVLVEIRNMPSGIGWTFVIFTTIWFTDSFALVGGRLYGRRKLARTISERKTVEGAITGFICAVIGAAFMLWIFDLPLLAGISVSIIGSLLTISGDLVASIFKRYINVKDTGSILPGHGGLIDRIDGLLLAVIPFYVYLMLF